MLLGEAVLAPGAIVEEDRAGAAAAAQFDAMGDGEGMAEIGADAADGGDAEMDDGGAIELSEVAVQLGGAQAFGVLDMTAAQPGEAAAVGGKKKIPRTVPGESWARAIRGAAGRYSGSRCWCWSANCRRRSAVSGRSARQEW